GKFVDLAAQQFVASQAEHLASDVVHLAVATRVVEKPHGFRGVHEDLTEDDGRNSVVSSGDGLEPTGEFLGECIDQAATGARSAMHGQSAGHFPTLDSANLAVEKGGDL